MPKLCAIRASSNERTDRDKTFECRRRAPAEYDVNLHGNDVTSDDTARHERSMPSDDPANAIDWNSFTVHRERRPATNERDDDDAGRLVCQWTLARSSADIDHYTIESQTNRNDWLPIGENIDPSRNRIELNVAALLTGECEPCAGARFRLTAHLNDGRTVTSEPTEEINVVEHGKTIVPVVTMLSSDAVRLTWNNETSTRPGLYDIERRDGPHRPWQTISTVPLTQGSACIDGLDHTDQCEYRLRPSTASQCLAWRSSSATPVRSCSDIVTNVADVDRVNERLDSLRIVPTSATTLTIDMSDDAFKQFDRYRVEYATVDDPDQWTQVEPPFVLLLSSRHVSRTFVHR
jgi:hypothetical protein